MSAVFPMEIVITPNTTYVLSDYSTPRRIYTDGRAWPAYQEPNFLGYTIGRWIDENGDGRFDVLEAETRHLKGPHVYEASGLPFHADNESVGALGIASISTAPIRHILTLTRSRPDRSCADGGPPGRWSIVGNYRRVLDERDLVPECLRRRQQAFASARRTTFIGADDLIWPAKEGQARPDLRHFE